MDYLQRLLVRALAVPRGQGAPLFDPFAQVAGVQADAAAAAPLQAARAEPGGTPMPSHAAEGAAPLTPPLPPLQGPTSEAPAIGASPVTGPPLVIAAPARVVAGTPAPPARLQPESSPPREPARLAEADAFMRSVGMAPAAAPKPAAVRQDMTPPGVNATGPDRPARTDAPTDTLRAPPLARPPVPQPTAMPHTRTAPGATRAAPHQPVSPAAAPVGRRTPAALAPERIVQTTVVVAPSARGLDDLAHSSSISRFGVGQS